ncbi:MAG: hypothetical protein ACJATF_002723 [Flavobacteriales bacterium]|jgi:hypothetical protein
MLKNWHVLLVVFLGLSFLFVKVQERNELMEENGVLGIAHVYQIKKDVVVSKVGRRDIVYLEYFASGRRVEFIRDVLNDDILVNACYEIRYVPQNVKVVDVFFGDVKMCPSEFLK